MTAAKQERHKNEQSTKPQYVRREVVFNQSTPHTQPVEAARAVGIQRQTPASE